MGLSPRTFGAETPSKNKPGKDKIYRFMTPITPTPDSVPATKTPVLLSIGIMARNEATTIQHTINSLFHQTVFQWMARMSARLEIVCIVNGSHDQTATVVRDLFLEASMNHPQRDYFTACVEEISESGKPNACNQYIHIHSAKDARYLVLMDADITFISPEAIWNLFSGLEQNREAGVTVGRPMKKLSRRKGLGIGEKLSRTTSQMTQSAQGQLSGQFYCIRTATARNIHFPRALTACDDGWVKNLVCTDFGNSPLQNERILAVSQAEHCFDPYLAIQHVIMNQKRQMMGQTFLHLLIDQFIPRLERSERKELGRLIRGLEENQPDWLDEMMTQHLLKTRFFWHLFPGFLTFRWHRWKSFSPGKRITLLPATVAGQMVTLLAGWLAARSLRQGNSRYWPELRGPSKQNRPQPTPSR